MTGASSAVRRAGILLSRLVLLLVAVAAPAAGADAPPRAAEPAPAATAAGDPVWHRVRFRIHMNPGETPKWSLDALVAHRIVAPALARERSAIVLWRFHRRAYADATGHSLSFITYAPRAHNAALCRALEADPLAADMIRDGLLDKVECEAFPASAERLVEGTSDSSWSPAVQRAWPYYIMGVSEMWLRLIDEHARQLAATSPPATTLGGTAAFYDSVNHALTQAWRVEGEHALLHHLNGLFGYEPIVITERRPYIF